MAATIAQDASLDRSVQVRLIGQFAITSGDRVAGPWPRPSARRLCEFILVSPGRRVSRDLACEELFPRLEPRAAARALSKALSMARAALGGLGEQGAALLAADLGHVWMSPDVEVDADVQEAALRDGLAMTPGQERDDRLSGALAQDADLLADEPYEQWAARPRERLAALRQEARLALARDRAMGSGLASRSGPDDVMAAWQSCLDHDPACEEAAGALIHGHVARGRAPSWPRGSSSGAAPRSKTSGCGSPRRSSGSTRPRRQPRKRRPGRPLRRPPPRPPACRARNAAR